MNNNTLYTRCPTCNTAFKVTDELLGLAGGKVRCGACLAVFQASDYMLRPSAEKESVSEQLPEQEPDSGLETKSDTEVDIEGSGLEELSSGQFDSVDDSTRAQIDPVVEETVEEDSQIDFDLDDDNVDDAENSEQPEDSNLLPDEVSSESDDGEFEGDLSELDLNDPGDDVSIDSEYQLSGTEETETEKEESEDSFEGFDYHDESSSYEDEPNDFDRDLIDDSESLDTLSDTEVELDEEQDTDQESEAEHDIDNEPSLDEHLDSSISAELENDSDPSIEISEWEDDDDFDDDRLDDSIEQDYDQESSDKFTETTEQEFENEMDNDLVDSIDDDLVQTFDEDFSEEQDEVTEEDFDELSGQLHEQMEETDTDPDPLDEFDEIAKDEKTGIKQRLIFAAIAVLMLIVIVQFWSNRQALAWSDSWGSSTKAICSFLPCNLQPKREVGSIKLLQRQLSPDEEKENFLDIKILLINEADFDQPYPTIKIKFSNKNGEQVSLKSFSPTDYLEGNAETLLMPSGSEVHIHFKTEVTHPDALGFEFIFE